MGLRKKKQKKKKRGNNCVKVRVQEIPTPYVDSDQKKPQQVNVNFREPEPEVIINHWTDFNITWQNFFLGDPLPRFFNRHDLSKNMPARGRGLFFPIYL